MKSQTLILGCIVLLAFASISFANKKTPGLNEWAQQYDPTKDIKKNQEYLRMGTLTNKTSGAVKHSSFDIIVKINQTEEGQPINTAAVNKVVNEVDKAIKKAKCSWTYQNTEEALSGSSRFALFAGIECVDDKGYLSLVNNDAGFYKNVIFSRKSERVKADFLSHVLDPIFEGPIKGPIKPWVPIKLPCEDYEQTRFKNWWSDIMDNGVMDCKLVKDDCTYNQGYGGRLIVMDSGVNVNHPEFAGMYTEGSTTSKLQVRKFLSTAELADQDPVLDNANHGTQLAALAIGKTFGAAKDASLISVKITVKNAQGGYEVSITALTAALKNILATVKNENLTVPTVIYSGFQLAWDKNNECNFRFDLHPWDVLTLGGTRTISKLKKRAVEIDPEEVALEPPTRYGKFHYDCSVPIFEAIRELIAHGVPYLIASGNGFASGEFGVANGVDMCFYAAWIRGFADCFDYAYLPAFMTDGFYSSPGTYNPRTYTSGYTNRPLIIGGYQENLENAKWSLWDDERGIGDMGGANYGSEWYKSTYFRERCVDYAAPAARFQSMAVNLGQLYGDWEDYGYNGVNFEDYYSHADTPFSGTSYAVPLAAASILSTMIQHWQSIKPIVTPNYGFGDTLLEYVDELNLIGTKITDDPLYAETYGFYSWMLTETDPLAPYSCANTKSVYYTQDRYPENMELLTIPKNRNLKMPAYRSNKPSCRAPSPPLNTGLNTGFNTLYIDPSPATGKLNTGKKA